LNEPVDLPQRIGPQEIAEGRVALISRLLELMITFIGEHLTVSLLREVWAQLQVDDLNSVSQGVIHPRQTGHARLSTGLPERIDRVKEAAPEPKAT
jgi:hypothetical protein